MTKCFLFGLERWCFITTNSHFQTLALCLHSMLHRLPQLCHPQMPELQELPRTLQGWHVSCENGKKLQQREDSYETKLCESKDCAIAADQNREGKNVYFIVESLFNQPKFVSTFDSSFSNSKYISINYSYKQTNDTSNDYSKFCLPRSLFSRRTHDKED